MRLTWIPLALLATLALVGCSEPEPPATLTATPGATPAAAPGQVAGPANPAGPTEPAIATLAPTTAADPTATLPPAAVPAAAAGPAQGAPTPAPVAVSEPIPELAPAPVPTPPAATASPLPEFVPRPTISPDDIYSFTHVSAGHDHSCGLRSDGRILCWGDGRNGETEPPEGTFTAVSAGDGYTCGIRSDGSVACWGIWGISYGMPVFTTSTHRRPESPDGVFKSISAGNAHACGIKADDTVECWGENHVSAGDFSHYAGQAESPPGTFLSVSAVGSTNCGVTTENQVVCWGERYEEVESPVGGDFLSVSAGGCGVKTDNTVVCWGERYFGELTPPAGKFDSVSVSWDNACGVRLTGEIECWGYYLWNAAPLGEFNSVSVSRSRRCAVRNDGAVACWGKNYGLDQLGLQSGITCGVLPNRATVCPGEDGYDLLATVHASDWVPYYAHSGSFYPCGNGKGGGIVCWDPYAEAFVDPTSREIVDFSAESPDACWILGNGTVGCYGHPRIGSPKGTFKSIAVGDGVGAGAFACGVRTSGELSCWDDGREWSNASLPEGIFKSVSAGFNHVCAIRMNDTVTCLGGGHFGGTFRSLDGGGYQTHCGIQTDNTLECWGNLSAIPGTFQSVSVQGAREYAHYCAVRTDGSLVCAGREDTGVTTPPEGSFQSVSIGRGHACAVGVDGGVSCWGHNAKYGEVTGEFLSVSAAEYFACGIRTDHTLACWGRVPDVLKNLSGIKPPPSKKPQPTATLDTWQLPLRQQLERLKQKPGPLAANVLDVALIYRFVGMMTEAEKAAMVEETELFLEELGPPRGKAKTHTNARIWLGLIEAFASSPDEFNYYRSISEYRLRVPFYVFLPEYLPPGFRNDGVGISGGGGWDGLSSGWTIHFARSSEWYPQLESGAYERITFDQRTNRQSGNPFREILPQIGGGEKIVLPNLEAAGIDDVRYWLGYSEWGAGGRSQYYQVAWEDPETDSFTHVISSLSLEETLKVVGSLR